MEADKDYRVLSIQSHVISGYVGNKSATFPLQVLGFEVDTINSVQFSNHTGYGFWKGQVLNEKDLNDLYTGLSHNGLDHFYTHLLTGYVGDAKFLQEIGNTVKKLKQVNPNLVYVCDPVMGDNGKLYVPKELLPIYQNIIVPLANTVTPNLFELELLTDRSIKSVDDALESFNVIHDMGVETVVLSSSDLGADNTLLCLASTKKGGSRKVIKIEFPKLPASFTGTGDLFAALYLAWSTKTNGDLKATLENTTATMQDVLKRTFQSAVQQNDGNLTVSSLELKLIQSKGDIEKPASTIVAEYIEG